MKAENRPFIFGPKNRVMSRVDDGEVAMRAINDGNGNPTHVGYAKVGTATSSPKWQIRKITYDGNNSPTQMQWPEDANGNASNDYEFIWDNALTYTYS